MNSFDWAYSLRSTYPSWMPSKALKTLSGKYEILLRIVRSLELLGKAHCRPLDFHQFQTDHQCCCKEVGGGTFYNAMLLGLILSWITSELIVNSRSQMNWALLLIYSLFTSFSWACEEKEPIQSFELNCLLLNLASSKYTQLTRSLSTWWILS